PIQRAIMEGDQESGVSLQVMVKKLDAGDVLGIRRIKIDDEMTAKELHDALMVAGADLLHIELMDYLRGNLVPHPQDEQLVTYASKIEKSEGQIDWSKSASQIQRQVRALNMGPGTYTIRNSKILKIHNV